jgi:hypothetical protein
MPRHLDLFDVGRIAGAWEMCHNTHLISKTLKIPRSTVQRWIKRYAQGKIGERESRPGEPSGPVEEVNSFNCMEA